MFKKVFLGDVIVNVVEVLVHKLVDCAYKRRPDRRKYLVFFLIDTPVLKDGLFSFAPRTGKIALTPVSKCV